jgi:small-conductance mechanosensitive channel
MVSGVLLLIAMLAPGPGFAADADVTGQVQQSLARAPAVPALETAPPPATLRFFNRGIVTFRASYFGLSPAERAAGGTQRIREILARHGPGAVKMVTTAEGLNVTVDGAYVFRILEGDLDADDGQTFDQARTIVSQRLQEAITAARSAMRGPELFRALALGTAATLGFVFVVWVIARVRLWIRGRIAVLVSRLTQLGHEERAAVLRLLRALGQAAFVVVTVALAEEWLRFVFGLFPYTRPWADGLTGYLAGIVGNVSGSIVAAVPGLLMVVVIAGLAQLASKVLRTIARGVEAGRYRLIGIDADVVHPARQLASAAIWLFALAMAYPYLPGSSSEAFKGLSVLVGLMLSLGASGLVGQAAGGFILTFSRTLRASDWVRVGEVEGAVVSVGMFSTKVRTFADEEVSIPNSVVLGNVTRNFSRPAAAPGSILETSVTIGYNAPWRQVHAMLLEAAARTPELEREPPPHVLQTALSDFYVQYSLRVRLLNQMRRPAVLSALNANVQDVFNEYGVQIMSPHYRFDPPEPVLVPKERWFEPPAGKPGDSTRGPLPRLPDG